MYHNRLSRTLAPTTLHVYLNSIVFPRTFKFHFWRIKSIGKIVCVLGLSTPIANVAIGIVPVPPTQRFLILVLSIVFVSTRVPLIIHR